jgi:hypothetical protein
VPAQKGGDVTEHNPEEPMAIVAADADPAELPDKLVDALLGGASSY